MPVTRNWLLRWHGLAGVDYLHELHRQGMAIMSEVVEESVASPGIPRTVDVLRRQVSVAPDSANFVPATWVVVAGLTGLTAMVHLPGWEDQGQPVSQVLRDGERMVIIADIPAAGGVSDDTLKSSDRLKYDDPTYGEQVFEIIELRSEPGTGLVFARVKYAKEETP